MTMLQVHLGSLSMDAVSVTVQVVTTLIEQPKIKLSRLDHKMVLGITTYAHSRMVNITSHAVEVLRFLAKNSASITTPMVLTLSATKK